MGDAGLRGSPDQLALCVRGRRDGQRDDEGLLPLERCRERLLVVVIHRDGADALGELVGAALPGERCHAMLAGLEELLGDELPDCATGLMGKVLVIPYQSSSRLATYTDDRNSLNAIDETSGLVLRVLGSHVS